MENNFFDLKINPENIPHALLIISEDWKETHNQVNLFIKKILCIADSESKSSCNKCKACLTFDVKSNPDFIEIKPDDKGKIGIGALRSDSDTSRGTINILNETALVSNAKIIKICNAEVLTEDAQNHLLKILEEPPKNSYILMLSSRPYKLKKTILSRLTSFSILPNFFNDRPNKFNIDESIFHIISKEKDIADLSDEEITSYASLYEETENSLDFYNYSKRRILDTWNDENLIFRLNILKNKVFLEISNNLNDVKIKKKTILSSLEQDGLFNFLEELISFQALMANKVAINKKIQLDSLFDLI